MRTGVRSLLLALTAAGALVAACIVHPDPPRPTPQW
jgi:hypothetical protein